MSSRLRIAAPSLAAVVLMLALAASLVRAAPADSPAAAGAAPWPPSGGLLVSEVMTGGAGASDEFVELYDAGPQVLDLDGDEVVYVTATGGTVTRKAAWATSRPLGPGQHLLIANVGGIFAAAADMTYSGGLAAAGGAIAVRAADGTVIDAVGWGTADNAFVEGAPAAAPAAGSSLERRPGGAAGNAVDTNDDSADWFIQPVPHPQALADPPVPPPSGTAPSPTDAASPATPTPTATISTPPPTSGPSPTSATGAPTPASAPPTATPASAVPSALPTPRPTASAAGATPQLETTPIAVARAAPRGTVLAIEGVLTVPLGLTDDGRGAFVQDATGGIALYLEGNGWPALAAGIQVRLSGTIDQRYGQATVRVAVAADLVAIGPARPPQARSIATGDAGETVEGLLVATSGTVTGTAEALADGVAVTVDDGSGPLRVVVPVASGIPRDTFVGGSKVAITGVLGERASSATGSGGYRLYPRTPADVQVVPLPTAGVTAGPSPRSSGGTIEAIASLTDLGEHVLVQGMVTSAGVVWGSDGRRLTVQDASGAILVRLPTGVRPPAVGGRVQVSGTVSHYLAAPELAADAPPVPLGAGGVVMPRSISHAPPPMALRWDLATASGTVVEVRHGAVSWRAVLRLGDGTRLTIGAPAAARVPAARIATGDRVAIVGILRPPATGSADTQLYLMARVASDVAVLRRTTSSVSGAVEAPPTPARTATAGALDVALADLARLVGRLVHVGGVVIASDATGLIIDDGTAQADVRLPADALGVAIPAAGTAVTLSGLVVADAVGAVAIALRTIADLSLAGDPGEASPEATAPMDSGTAAARPAGQVVAAATPGAMLPAVLDLLALAAAFVAGGAALVARRRRRAVDGASRRRVTGRLAALRGPAPDAPARGREGVARSPDGGPD